MTHFTRTDYTGMSDEEWSAAYYAKAHSVQTGIAYYQQLSPASATPKQLMVGNDMNKVETYALLDVLYSKGVVTQDEYKAALLKALDERIDFYQKFIASNAGPGTKVTLI